MPSKPFEITLRPHVLKGRELEYLLEVKTSPNQAKRIYVRNLKLLNFLQKFKKTDFKEHSINIKNGCPHCHCKCVECEWQAYRRYNSSVPMLSRCCHAKFGRYDYHYARYYPMTIGYSSSEAFLIISEHNPCSETKKTYTVGYNKMFKIVSTFLQGHLEWAIAVIEGK
jgi:hypothetical protein